MIADAAAVLIEQAGLAVAGKSLFLRRVPEGVQKCILVIDSYLVTERDDNIPGYLKGDFTVIIRHTDYQIGISIAKKVVAALNLYEVEAGGYHIKRMRSTQEPVVYPVPPSDIIEVELVMWAAYTELT